MVQMVNEHQSTRLGGRLAVRGLFEIAKADVLAVGPRSNISGVIGDKAEFLALAQLLLKYKKRE